MSTNGNDFTETNSSVASNFTNIHTFAKHQLTCFTYQSANIMEVTFKSESKTYKPYMCDYTCRTIATKSC